MNTQFNPEGVQFLSDPRNNNNILIVGEKFDNGKLSQGIRMINLEKLIEEDSGIIDFPNESSDDNIYLTSISGSYSVY